MCAQYRCAYLIMSAISFCGLTSTIWFSVMKNFYVFTFGTFSSTKGGKSCNPISDGTLLPILISFMRGTCSICMSLRFSLMTQPCCAERELDGSRRNHPPVRRWYLSNSAPGPYGGRQYTRRDCSFHDWPEPYSNAHRPVETKPRAEPAVPFAPSKLTNNRNIRFGSKADMRNAKRHVRCYSKSGHVQCNSVCLLCANSGHAHSITSLASASTNSGYGQPDRFCGLQTQWQPILCRLSNGRVSWLRPLNIAIPHHCGAAPQLRPPAQLWPTLRNDVMPISSLFHSIATRRIFGLNSLSNERRLVVVVVAMLYARNVATWTRQTVNESRRNRITGSPSYYRRYL